MLVAPDSAHLLAELKEVGESAVCERSRARAYGRHDDPMTT
jgi:hypothetical protein